MNDDNFDPQDGADSAVPFARLKPEIVLDALDSVLSSVGVYTDGRMLPLNSYENRVYQVGVEDGPWYQHGQPFRPQELLLCRPAGRISDLAVPAADRRP